MTREMRLTDWVMAGATDAANRTIYERSPAPEPPAVPDEDLPPEWRAYFDGHHAYISDRMRRLGRARSQAPCATG